MPAENNISPLPGFYRHIEACNQHEPAYYIPLLWQESEIGLIRRDNTRLLTQFADVFSVEDEVIRFHVQGDFSERTATLDTVIRKLDEQGVLKFHDEPYRLTTGWADEPIAEIDRSAAALFGIRAYGVHLNGFVRRMNSLSMWVGHRAHDRGVAPGQLDQMVAGGLPARLTAFETMRKEAGEEAGIPAALAAEASAVSAISYRLDVAGGVKRDTIFTFDLEVPPDFTPRNTDGEVERFELLPVEDVAEIVRTTDRFKWNCNLVIIDFLIRHGYLDSAHPDYTGLCAGLHKAL